ncbi:MAG: O-antigen ligase family protein [Gemmatimonadales bacterium]|nr:O-antigen ligase family protein [Gemmatimonadales bacterium]
MLVLPGMSVMPKVTGALALGLAVMTAVLSGRFRRVHPFQLMALLFVLWAGVVLLIVGGAKLPNKYWTWPQLLLVAWMIWELAPSANRVRGLLTAYVFGAYVAVLNTLLLYRREAGALRRFAAGGADPNDLAMVLALGIPMAWYLGTVYHRPLLRWACRAYLPAAVVAVGLTGSRGGLLATTVALLIVPLSMTRLSPGRLAAAISMLALAGILAVAYTPDRLVQRFASTGTELEGGLGGRGRLWRAGLEAFTQRPLVGYGTGGFRVAITPMLGENVQVAHNSFISVMVEQGAIGLLIYLAMLAAVLLSAYRLRHLERRFALVLLATLLMAMLPLTWEDRRAAWVVLSTVTGLAAVGASGGLVPRQPSPARAPTLRGRPKVTRPADRPTVPAQRRAGPASA